MRTPRVVAVAAGLSLLAVFGYWVGNQWDPELPISDAACTVEADQRVRLDFDQMANAATITATGVRLEMPERAIVVALATAFQESKLRNLPHLGTRNDHDSIGLFQQRPSQGWGSEDELRDPRFAAERFYVALREVSGWEEMRVTDAAQRVQRSAYPEAYQQWEPDATVLTTALLGQAGGAVTCRGGGTSPARGTGAVAAVTGGLSRDWGDQVLVEAAGDASVRVVAADPAAGWRYAHWLVSHADELGVTLVHFDDLAWRASAGTWEAAGDTRDHVHVEVTTSLR